MNGGADAPLGGGAHHRAAHITAAANDQIRPHFLEDSGSAGAGQRQMVQGHEIATDILHTQLALKAVDFNVVEGIARLGDKAVLHAFPASGKMDLGGGVRLFQRSCDGKRRVDMTGSTAGSNENTHNECLLRSNRGGTPAGRPVPCGGPARPAAVFAGPPSGRCPPVKCSSTAPSRPAASKDWCPPKRKTAG